MIGDISLRLLRVPLGTPYKLAFGPVTQFDTILAFADIAGSGGVGEATILTGYTDETVEESWTRVQEVARRLPGLGLAEGKAEIGSRLAEAPFTATALITSLEMAEGHPALRLDAPVRVPLLAGINATDRDGVAAEIDAALAAGFATLKIKVGFDVEADLARVAFIQRHNAGRARLRVDANQGYDRAAGCRFASEVSPADIELLEQPCSAEDWDGLTAVAKVAVVPLMLDESIYDEDDIRRAARIGASFVKLKLMKFISLDRLERGLALIRAQGMEPVLGNGVACEIGCWMEACIARRLITNAGEMNGFLRPAQPLSLPPIAVEGGAMVLGPGGPPRLDPAALDRFTVASARFLRSKEGAS